MADEAEIPEEEESLPPTTEEGSTSFARKLATLKSRCEAAKVDYVLHKDEEGTTYATISIQAGPGKRRLPIFNERRADALLGIEFEKFRFLSGYEAICSYKDGLIEAGLASTRMSAQYLLRRLSGQSIDNQSDPPPIEFSPPSNQNDRPTIVLSRSSAEFEALCGLRTSRFSLKLKGTRSKQHDHAIAELRSYADSFFFQIDALLGTTFSLQRQRRLRILPPPRRAPASELIYPTAHYNEEAMSLYWYAKSAPDMPLLRFLAFYQSIEFYFPRYSQTEARRRVSSILKQPTFRPYREDDVDRLISAIQSTRGAGLGSERSQLRAVVSECISADDMRSYLIAIKEREEHFSGKTPRFHKIPLANKNADLRNDVADRIYDIRCKIVHTKNEYADDDF